MAKAAPKNGEKDLKNFSVHLPQVKLSPEEEARRFNNLKSLIAKAKDLYAPRK